MDLNFTDEQIMLRDNIDKYLSRNGDFDARQSIVSGEQSFNPQIWRDWAEMGLFALPFSQEQGGLGGTIVDSVAICEIFGKHIAIEPYISSIILGGGALALARDDGPLHSHLEAIISGAEIAAFAHEEGKGTAHSAMTAMAATLTDDTVTLNGEKRYVLGAQDADIMAVTARTSGQPGEEEGLTLMALDPRQEGVSMQGFDTVDGRRAAHVRFHNVAVPDDQILGQPGMAYPMIERLIVQAILTLSAEAVGAMGALMSITSTYGETRKQFGTPIASFQAVKHRLADMYIAHQKARATLLYTSALVEAGTHDPKDISVLKGQIGKLGRAVGEAAVQTHGGVGMTDELNVGHYFKRLLAIDAMFGNAAYHLRNVGRAA